MVGLTVRGAGRIVSNMTDAEIVEELMQTYTTTGKIGDYTPKSKKEALEIANTIAFKIKGKSND